MKWILFLVLSVIKHSTNRQKIISSYTSNAELLGNKSIIFVAPGHHQTADCLQIEMNRISASNGNRIGIFDGVFSTACFLNSTLCGMFWQFIFLIKHEIDTTMKRNSSSIPTNTFRLELQSKEDID